MSHRQMNLGVAVRDATAQDNDALVALAAQCPMDGDIGLCIDRAPEFMALNRLEGDRFRLGVVDDHQGHPVGCIAVSWRSVFLNGAVSEVAYISDLKVHPEHRRGFNALALIDWARQLCNEPDHAVPAFITVLAGNQAMTALTGESRLLPRLQPVATIRSFSIPLLWPRRVPNAMSVRRAEPDDLEAMVNLWNEIAPLRHNNRPHDIESFRTWLANAPGLDLIDYLLAFGPDGRLLGFLGLWDQYSFKQTRITSYSRALGAFRQAFNLVAPTVGGVGLPRPGQHLRSHNAVNICVRPTDGAVLRTLVLHAYQQLRGSGSSFFTVGLDRRDPLCAAMKGLLAQPTDVVASLVTDVATAPALDHRPLQHEIALV